MAMTQRKFINVKKVLKLKNKPSIIICHTVKGKGIKIAEKSRWHLNLSLVKMI